MVSKGSPGSDESAEWRTAGHFVDGWFSTNRDGLSATGEAVLQMDCGFIGGDYTTVPCPVNKYFQKSFSPLLTNRASPAILLIIK